jgi:endonuclease/exonuclease/phosphatase family metal-dependent hydrolase
MNPMKKSLPIISAFALVILFFIQLAGTLVESIYIQDLMNLKLDEKAVGVLFFFAPVLLFPLFRRFARPLAWSLAAILLIARGLLPYLNTSNRLLAAGMGTVAAASLLFLLLAARPGGTSATRLGFWGAAGLGLAVTLSGFLRAAGHGLEYSLIPAGGWLGWGLGVVLVVAVLWLDWETNIPPERPEKSVTGAVMGVILVLTLVWFSFSAPSVIARWTEGNYTLIVALISLLAAVTAWICITRPQWLDRIDARLLLLWNILFTLSLTATLLAQQVAYPPTPDSPPVVVTSPGVFGQLALILTLVLFPILLIDLRAFITRIALASPAPRGLVPGFLLGMLLLVLMVFANIFSNVWGYVPPVSPWFRGTFWLAFFLLAGAVTLLAWLVREPVAGTEPIFEKSIALGWGILLGALFLGTLIQSLPVRRVQVDAANRKSLLVMTYNIQDGNDNNAEKSFDRQLTLMRKVSPDIVSLQESDLTRISLNNNDYVRYYADQLGYYTYFGPSTVTGTYGTALLSKYPLENTRTIYSYSDEDEIGTTEAEIEVNGRRFTIFDVHPAGSETAKLAFARTLLEQSRDKPYVIALGDYNLRDYEDAYQLIDSVYTNAWTSVYPTEISPDGVDMSGDNRIDHIFLSPSLHARNPVYLLPPDSATDHPVHWAEVYWENP